MPSASKESVYLDPDLSHALAALCKRYPVQSRSAFINAALRFYLPYAQRGIDGNLAPYTLETGPTLDQANYVTRDEVLALLNKRNPST